MSRVEWNLHFIDRFFEKYSNFLIIRPVGAELLLGAQTDRQTDRHTETTNLIVAFHSFVNANVQAELLVLVSFLRNAGLWGKYGWL